MLSRSTLYTVLAIVFLLILFAAVARGGSTGSGNVTADAQDAGGILGMMAPNTSSSSSFVDQLLHSGKENAKDLATQKVIEVKTAVVETLKKEVSRLTDAQVKQLTTQLCTDWGVIPLSPTPTPEE